MKRAAAYLLVISLGGGLGAPARVFGSSSGGKSAGAAFLAINPSVRGEALGGMNPAASDGAQALGVNPANMGLDGGSEFTSGFASMIGGSGYGTLGLVLGRAGGVTVGGQAVFLQSGSLEGRDAAGNATTAFQSRSMAGGIGAAMGAGMFQVGATVKAVREEIGVFKSNTVPAGDLGVSFKTGSIGWGLAALNVGGGIKFQGEKASLPTIYGLGASVPLGGGLTGLVGLGQVAGDTVANLGMEYRLKSVSVRFGYRSDAGGPNLALKSQSSGAQALQGLTGGFGIGVGNLRLDYAVSQTAAEWGLGHRASMTFRWGGDAERSAPQPRAAAPARRPVERLSSGAASGGHRAYDSRPLQKTPSNKKWVE